MRLLLAEDEAHAGEYLVKGLGENGFVVDWVRNGTDALAHANASDYDLIILDVGLPGMDGYQVARRMREEALESKLTIIALSGYGQTEDHSQSMQAGCDAHLVKPVHPNVLRSMLGAEIPSLS